MLLLFERQCAGLLLEQQRVVQPRCVRLLAVRLLPVQRRCAGLLLEQQRLFSLDALGF